MIQSILTPGRGTKTSQTIGYYGAFIGLGFSASALGPTLRNLADHTGTGPGQISLLFTASSIGYLAGSLLGGRWYDRVPGHPLMALTLVMMAASMLLIPVIPLLHLLSAAFLVLGLSQGVLDVGGNTLLVWVHRAGVAPFMNGLHFFFGVGALLAPVIIAQTRSLSGDVVWGYWALAALMLPAAGWLARLPSPRLHQSAEDRSSRNGDYRLVVLIALFLFLNVGAEIGFGGWISSYALALDLSGEQGADYLASGFWGLFTLGRLLAIPIAARLRASTILASSLVSGLVCTGVLLLGSASPAVTWIGALGLGLSIGPIFPTTISLAERHLTITSRVTGWFLVGGSLGSMSLPWLIGQLFEGAGPVAGMATVALALFLALAVLAAMNWLAVGRAREEQPVPGLPETASEVPYRS